MSFRKDPKYNNEFNRSVKILFEYINHRNSDLRMLSEQTMDSVLRVGVMENESISK